MRCRLVLAATAALALAACASERSAAPASSSVPATSVPTSSTTTGSIPRSTTTSSTTTAAPTTTTTPGCPGDPAGPDTWAQLTYEGVDRTYLVTTPTAAPVERRLVLNLHGWAGSAADTAANTGLAPLAAAAGDVVVTPDALGEPREWNFSADPARADDHGFLRALIDDALDRYCVGTGEVLLVGSSNGAAMVGLYACTDPRVVAVAMVLAVVPSTCPDGAPIPSVLAIRGTADPLVPYEGSDALVATWAAAAGCDPTPTASEVWPGVSRSEYHGCPDGQHIALDTIQDGTHAWPGGLTADRPDDSEAGRTYPAAQQIVDAFATV